MKPLTTTSLETLVRDAIARDDTDEIARLGVILDDLEAAEKAARPLVTLGAAALWYAEQGLHVFPLMPLAKIPYKGSAGFKDASSDAEVVRAWWTQRPDSNIGIATGHLVDVVDIDGPTGNHSLARMLDGTTLDDPYRGRLPTVIGVVSTPRPGGRHLYVAASGRGNKAGLFPGVDHRGLGGYVVAAPSVTDDRPGQHAGSYVWVRDLDLSGVA